MENSSQPGGSKSSSSTSSNGNSATTGSGNNESATNKTNATNTTTTTTREESKITSTSGNSSNSATTTTNFVSPENRNQLQGGGNGAASSYYHHRSPSSASGSSPASSMSTLLNSHYQQLMTAASGGGGSDQILVNISTTTGGSFSVKMDQNQSVEQLKKAVAKKLRVSKDRICLLHRERELQEGTLRDNGLCEGSKIILIPNVETGLLAQRPESTVMQALESLNDSQVNDFLSGKSPLNLNMRLGDHMMIIQLQLSTVNPPSLAAPTTSSSAPSTSSAQTMVGHNCHSHSQSGSSSMDTTGAGKKRSASSSLATSTSSSTGNSTRHHTTSSKSSRHYHCQQQAHCQRPSSSATSTQSSFASYSSHRCSSSQNQSVSQSSSSSSMIFESPESALSTHGAPVNLTDKSTALAEQPKQHPINVAGTTEQMMLGNVPATSNATTTAIREEAISDSVLNIEANTNASDEVLDEIMKFHDESDDEGIAEEASELTAQNNLTAINEPSISEMTTEGEEEDDELESRETCRIDHDDQSPVKSLSNLVSGPILNDPVAETQTGAAAASQYSDPIAAKLTSCLCKRFDTSLLHCDPTSCSAKPVVQEEHHLKPRLPTSRSAMDLTTHGGGSGQMDEVTAAAAANSGASRVVLPSSGRHQWLHRTANNPILKSKAAGIGGGKPNSSATSAAMAAAAAVSSNQSASHGSLRRTMSNPLDGALSTSVGASEATPVTAEQMEDNNTSGSGSKDAATGSASGSAGVPTVIDTRALAEASRNLTQTLKKLSKEVFTNKVDLSENNSKRIGTGAVIESMKHHGKGIYSGTFSGTLNPALQDRFGRPKRDISTIIHILNDLLSATPQYRRGATISFDTGPPSTSGSGGGSVSGGGSSGHQSHGHHHSSHGSGSSSSHHNHHHHGHHAKGSPMSASGSSKGQMSSTRSSRSHHHHHHHHHHSHSHHSNAHHHHHQHQSSQQQSSLLSSSTGSSSNLSTRHSKSSEMRPCICHVPVTTASGGQDDQMIVQTPVELMEVSGSRLGATENLLARLDGGSESAATDGDSVIQLGTSSSGSGLLANLPTCCSKCSSVAMENHKTKSKLEQLRLVMQQKKERREARKAKNAPYGVVAHGGGVGGGGGHQESGKGTGEVVKNLHQSTNYSKGGVVAAAASATTTSGGQAEGEIGMDIRNSGVEESSIVATEERQGDASLSSPSSADSSMVADNSSVVENEGVAEGTGGEASEGTTTADSSNAGEDEQQQQQQQNHLVEEVDTAA